MSAATHWKCLANYTEFGEVYATNPNPKTHSWFPISGFRLLKEKQNVVPMALLTLSSKRRRRMSEAADSGGRGGGRRKRKKDIHY